MMLWCKKCEEKNGWLASKQKHEVSARKDVLDTRCLECGNERVVFPEDECFKNPVVIRNTSTKIQNKYPMYNSSTGQVFDSYSAEKSFAKKNGLEGV